jgi:HK97 family phage prohead protease
MTVRLTLQGYAMVWGDLARDVTLPDGRRVDEMFRRGAFADACARISDAHPLPYFHGHADIMRPDAMPAARIVKAREDRIGLHLTMVPLDTAVGRDLVAAVSGGAISAQSVLFTGETREEQPRQRRSVVTRAELISVSSANRPCYHATTLRLVEEPIDDGHPMPAAEPNPAAQPAVTGESNGS